MFHPAYIVIFFMVLFSVAFIPFFGRWYIILVAIIVHPRPGSSTIAIAIVIFIVFEVSLIVELLVLIHWPFETGCWKLEGVNHDLFWRRGRLSI